MPAPSHTTRRAMSTWKIDTAHSTIEFVAKHMMITNVKGRFKTFDGEIIVDGEDPETAVVNVTFETASVDTGHDQRDGHLRSPDFFDAATFPNITFTSTKVEKLREDHFKVTGDLTIRDVTRPVELDMNVD